MNPWIRAGLIVIGGAGWACAVLAQESRSPVLQAQPMPVRAPDVAATAAPVPSGGTSTPLQGPAAQMQPVPTQPVRTPPPQWRSGVNASVPASQAAASAAVPIEERLARLEAALLKANARIVELETRMRTHTHEYPRQVAGTMVEKLNGRDVPLAIGPRWEKGTTGPALP